MHAPPLLLDLLLTIAIAAVGVAVFQRLRLPAIAGFLVMGALLGPGGLRVVGDTEDVRAIAELGVVFLLFEIGLELPVERLRRMWRLSLAAGGLQVSLTLALVAGVAAALGLEGRSALVLGALVAMSSTALVMRILADRGEVGAPHGQLAIGILLFQDLCIVPFLLAVPLLALGGPAFSPEVGTALLRALLGLALFSLAARFLLPQALDLVARRASRDLFTLFAFLVVVGSAVVAAEIGLTLAVGAFVGGLVLSASPYAYQLFAEVVPLRGVLLGVFFAAIGMLFDPQAAVDDVRWIAGYVSGVIALKVALVGAVVAFLLRQGIRVGTLTGLALAQTGEFSFVLAAAAEEAGLLDPRLLGIFIAGSIATLLATPFLVAVGPRVATFLARGADRRGALAPAGEDEALAGHVILCGFGLAGRALAGVLRARGVRYVAIEANARAVQELRARGEPVFFGDASRQSVLERLGARRAVLVVIAISDPVATREVVRLLRALGPDVPIVARAHYVLEVDRLYQAGATTVVAEEFESTIELVAAALRAFGLPDGAIARFTAELREEGYEPLRASPALGIDPWLTELLDQVSAEWIEVPPELDTEQSLIELRVRERTGASVLAVERAGVTTPNPDPGTALRAGDRLLVFGSDAALARLRELLSGAGRG